MTNSYNLSLRPKIIFIHGLNNNISSFKPLVNHFLNLGFEAELIVLPGHADDRHHVSSLKEGLESFDHSMKHLKGTPYYIVAFSHGALYLELWLNEYQSHFPLKKVLLAPALYVRRQKILSKVLKILPSFIRIKSLSPKDFRRYGFITAGEYRILMDGISRFQKLIKRSSVPSMAMIDPQDELVDAQMLKQKQKDVIFIDRPNLKKGIGGHHILFHPEYFTEEEWRDLTRKIEIFLGINAEA